MIKIVICDDVKTDSDCVYQYVRDYLEERKLQGEIRVFDHPDLLLEACENYRAHIYILDIVMPMLTGIEAARELRWNQPEAQIIFATSEKSYALESFDVNPINYIVKPVDKTKLWETLDLAMRHVSLEEEKAFTVKIKGGYSTLQMNDIMYIDYRNHVVTYHLYSKEEVSTPTLRIGFAEYLKQNHSDGDFVQCHESIAVQVGAIDKLSRTELMVRNKEVLPVSKSRYPGVSESYLNYRFRD